MRLSWAPRRWSPPSNAAHSCLVGPPAPPSDPTAPSTPSLFAHSDVALLPRTAFTQRADYATARTAGAPHGVASALA